MLMIVVIMTLLLIIIIEKNFFNSYDLIYLLNVWACYSKNFGLSAFWVSENLKKSMAASTNIYIKIAYLLLMFD